MTASNWSWNCPKALGAVITTETVAAVPLMQKNKQQFHIWKTVCSISEMKILSGCSIN